MVVLNQTMLKTCIFVTTLVFGNFKTVTCVKMMCKQFRTSKDHVEWVVLLVC